MPLRSLAILLTIVTNSVGTAVSSLVYCSFSCPRSHPRAHQCVYTCWHCPRQDPAWQSPSGLPSAGIPGVDYQPFRSCHKCEVVWYCSETCEAENHAAHKHECTGYADDRR